MDKKLLEQLTGLITHQSVSKFIESATSIEPGKGYPYLSYFGINYTDDKIINFKVYFAFFRKLNEKEVKKLLPDPNRFYIHYKDWQEGTQFNAEHTGCSFAIKIDTNYNVTNYFHYRTNLQNTFSFKNLDSIEEEILSNNTPFCEEYVDGKVLQKHYRYICKPLNITALLKRFNVSFFDTHKLPMVIEYTESKKADKIILGIDDINVQKIFMDSLPDGSIKKLIIYLCDKFNLMTASPGIYNDGKSRAIYFVEKAPTIYFTNTNVVGALKDSLFKGLL